MARKLCILTCLWAGTLATSVNAHAAEQGFVLLLPTNLYIASGTAAVALSLTLVGLVRHDQINRLMRSIRPRRAPVDLGTHQWVGALSTTLFLLLCLIGLFGPTDPLSNLLPLAIWTLWWIGFVVLIGVVGDHWEWINPFDAPARLLFKDDPPLLRYPKWLGVWPAVVMIVAFNAFAIADVAPNDPRRLATFALCYWGVTLLAMRTFGATDWRHQAECFGVMFRLIGRVAPLQRGKEGGLGFPGWAITNQSWARPDIAIFCICLLATGSFDGLHETFWWLAQIGINPLEFPGRSAVFWTSTLGLLAANLALVAIFALAVWTGLALNRRLGGGGVTFRDAFCGFAVSLLPIALGYHFAHFLTSFLVQIQYVLRAANDPLGKGWSLLGLEGFQVTTGFLNTAGTVRTIWLTQAGAVVASHILAVLIAHHIAVRLAPNGRDAVLIQVGIAVLMVAYTVFGLWLLASPRGV